MKKKAAMIALLGLTALIGIALITLSLASVRKASPSPVRPMTRTQAVTSPALAAHPARTSAPQPIGHPGALETASSATYSSSAPASGQTAGASQTHSAGNSSSSAGEPAVPAGPLYKNKVGVLMFHDLDESQKGADILKPEQFAADLDYLKAKGFHFISLQQFKLYMKGAPVPDNALLVTFDDGYENYYTEAYPIMAARHIPGVSFVITGDFSKSALVYTPHMTKQEIMKMTHEDNDMEVQAHTNNLHYKIDPGHDALTGKLKVNGKLETDAQYRQRILADMQLCVSQLQPLTPHLVDAFAYPYGLSNPTVLQVLHQAGIHYAFTIKPGLANRGMNPLLLPRINGGNPKITPEKLYASLVFQATHPGSSNNLYHRILRKIRKSA